MLLSLSSCRVVSCGVCLCWCLSRSRLEQSRASGQRAAETSFPRAVSCRRLRHLALSLFRALYLVTVTLQFWFSTWDCKSQRQQYLSGPWRCVVCAWREWRVVCVLGCVCGWEKRMGTKRAQTGRRECCVRCWRRVGVKVNGRTRCSKVWRVWRVVVLRSHPIRHALGAQVPSDLLGHGRFLRHHEHLQGRHGDTGSRTMDPRARERDAGVEERRARLQK